MSTEDSRKYMDAMRLGWLRDRLELARGETDRHIRTELLRRVAEDAMRGLHVDDEATSIPAYIRARIDLAWHALAALDPGALSEAGRERLVVTRRALEHLIGACALGVQPRRKD